MFKKQKLTLLYTINKIKYVSIKLGTKSNKNLNLAQANPGKIFSIKYD